MADLSLSPPAGARSARTALGLLVLFGLLALLTLGCLPLIDEDEGEYAEVAAELAAADHWLAPTLNGQPFYEKPILLFWGQAALVRLAGPVEWAFRLPSLLCTVAWVGVLIAWARRGHDLSAGLGAGWLAATCAGMVIAGRAATMDAPLILLLTLTLRDLWCWLEGGTRAPLRRAALWSALGLLLKGPVALVIPGGSVLLMLACTPTLRPRWRALADPWAWLILLGVGLPWYVWYGLHSEGAFLHYFLGRENAGRLQGSLQGHGGSVFYYLAVLPLLLLPHGLLFPRLATALRKAWAHREERFLCLWFAWVFVLFSLAGTKLPHYLLYGCTPLFLIGGRRLAASQPTGGWGLAAGLAAGLILPVVAQFLPAVAAQVALHDGNPYIREMMGRAPDLLAAPFQWRAGVWLASALLAAALAWRLRAQPLGVVVPPGVVSACGISLVLLPVVTGLQQDPVRAAARVAAAQSGPVVSDNRMPSFSVYLGRPTEIRAVRAGDIAFGRIDHPDRLGARHEALFAAGGIRLVRVIAP